MAGESNRSLASQTISIAVGVALFVLLILAGYRIITLFVEFLAKLDRTVTVAVIAGSVTITTSTLTVVLGRYFEAKRDREAAHRQRKIELYDEFLGKLFSIFLGGDEKKQKEEAEDLVPFLREVQRKLVLWSGPNALKAYAQWHDVMIAQRNEPRAKSMIHMVDFFLALRSDLGHSNRGVKRDHLISFMLRSPELFMEMYRKNPNVSFAEIAAIEARINSESQQQREPRG